MFCKLYTFAFPLVFCVCFMLSGGILMTISGCLNAENNGVIKNDIAAVKQTAKEIKTGVLQTNNSLKTCAKKIENLNQTNNSGMFSGGAPYLLSVIMALLWYLNRKEKVSAKEKLKEQEFINEMFLKLLAEEGKTEAEIKEFIDMAKGK